MAPQARPLRRTVTNENDENATTRVTRAKAAALGAPSETISKKPVMTKKNTTAAQAILNDGLTRKRTALGDVSNMAKSQAPETKETKKPVGIAKAAQPTGVSKVSRGSSTRSTLGIKDRNSASNDLKRPASVAGSSHNVTKKRATASTGSSRKSIISEDASLDIENIEPLSNTKVKVTTEIIKTTTTIADGTRLEKEVKREERVVDLVALKRQKALDRVIESMDREDDGDPVLVGEYVYEIIDYMKHLETKTAANPSYMDNQGELEWRMRGVLIDWLLEVHIKFHLLPETLYLAVNIIDRFLSSKVIGLDRLQLVGVTALFIASKYEEVLSPHIGNFSHVADDGFTDAEILSAERFILNTLGYNLSFPSPMHFMRRISKADDYDIATRTLAKYLLEISILDHRFLEFTPSMNAAAAMHLARVILAKGPWNELLEHYAGYTEEQITPTVHCMIDFLQGTVKHEAFYKKYAAKRFMKASLYARAWAKKYTGDVSQALPGRSP